MLIDPRNRLFIPKDFVSSTRISDGPMAGVLARPCLCGVAVQPGEPAILIGNNLGEVYLVHPEHAPASVMAEGDDDAEL
jgi:hypothetical protein